MSYIKQKPDKRKAKVKAARRLKAGDESMFDSNGWLRRKIGIEDRVRKQIRMSKAKGMELKKV